MISPRVLCVCGRYAVAQRLRLQPVVVVVAPARAFAVGVRQVRRTADLVVAILELARWRAWILQCVEPVRKRGAAAVGVETDCQGAV